MQANPESQQISATANENEVTVVTESAEAVLSQQESSEM